MERRYTSAFSVLICILLGCTQLKTDVVYDEDPVLRKPQHKNLKTRIYLQYTLLGHQKSF